MILRTIHVGVGGRGSWPIEVMGGDPQFKPVAIVENVATTAKIGQYRLGEKGHKNVPIFSGLTGALSQIEADALVICTPTRTHAEFCQMAFTVSMHVLVEAGMTSDFEQARQLVKEAQSAWSKFCVVQDQRYAAAEQTVAYILSKPDHPHNPGKVHLVDYVCHRFRPDPGPSEYSFQMVWDMAVHHVDTLRFWLGAATRVTARSYVTPWTQHVHDSNLSAVIEYESGAICNYSLSNDAMVPQSKVMLQGERGALVLTDGKHLRFHPKPNSESGSADVVDLELMDCPMPEKSIASEFIRYVVDDVEPGISGRRNLRSLAVCEALVRSAKNKRTVEIAELKSGGTAG